MAVRLEARRALRRGQTYSDFGVESDHTATSSLEQRLTTQRPYRAAEIGSPGRGHWGHKLVDTSRGARAGSGEEMIARGRARMMKRYSAKKK
jgi:hypothetical protein